MEILFNKEEIDFKTKIIAKNITDEHRGDGTPIVFVCLLTGGFMFFSDLTQEIRHDIEVDFMRVKSYIGKKKQGDIQVTKDLETSIKNKHVYIVDDIYDSGRTMQAVMKYLRVKDPKSLNIVTLLKREQNAVDASEFADNFIHGFEIKGEWVVGYGMDNEKGYCRNYAGIFAV